MSSDKQRGGSIKSTHVYIRLACLKKPLYDVYVALNAEH